MSDLSPMDKAAEKLIACQYDATGFSTDGCSQVMDGLFVAKEYRRMQQEIAHLNAQLERYDQELQKVADILTKVHPKREVMAVGLLCCAEALKQTLASETKADEGPIDEAWLLANGFLKDGDDSSKSLGRSIWEKGQTESFHEEPRFQLLVENGAVWLEAYAGKGGETLAIIELPIETRPQLVRLINALKGEK